MSDPLSLTASQVEALAEDAAAQVLAAWVKAKQTSLPEALALSKSKVHAKLAKKALYQLKSKGAEVVEPPPAGPSVEPLPEKEDENLLATMSPVLGTGERALFFPKPMRGGGIEIYQVILSDEFGVAQFDRAQANRAIYRGRIKELRAQTDVSLQFVPLSRVIEELGRAVSLNDRSGTNIPSDIAEALNRLGVVPLDPDWPIPACTPDDVKTVSTSAALHDEPELAQWLPNETDLTAMAEVPADVKSDPTKAEAKATELAAAFLDGPMRQRYARRLWRNAELFDDTNRGASAELARATARHLFHTTDANPFTVTLFSKAFRLDPADKVKALLGSMPRAGIGAPPLK